MDDDGPEDGDDSESTKPGPGKFLLLPGGKTSEPRDTVMDYVEPRGGLHKKNSNAITEIIDPVAIDAEVRERERYVRDQRLVEIVTRRGTASELGDAVVAEIAEELAHIKFERRKASKDGKNTTGYSVSRIAGLRSLADLVLKRLEASRSEQLDLKSPRLQAIFKVWMEFLYESMEKSGVESQIIDLVFQQMKADMIGWEKRMDGGAGVE